MSMLMLVFLYRRANIKSGKESKDVGLNSGYKQLNQTEQDNENSRSNPYKPAFENKCEAQQGE